jgi:hypothetical protein
MTGSPALPIRNAIVLPLRSPQNPSLTTSRGEAVDSAGVGLDTRLVTAQSESADPETSVVIASDHRIMRRPIAAWSTTPSIVVSTLVQSRSALAATNLRAGPEHRS